jgi:putative oxidoreductase
MSKPAAAHRPTATDIGLLVIRVGIGIMFVIFGYPKLVGGPEKWAALGAAMGAVGITFAPAFWGFMAAVSEFVGGIALILGLLVRPFAFLLMGTMIVATTMLIRGGAELIKFSHALDMAIVFAGLVVTGGGSVAIGRLFRSLAGKWFQ